MAIYLSDENGQLKKVAGKGVGGSSGGSEVTLEDLSKKLDKEFINSDDYHYGILYDNDEAEGITMYTASFDIHDSAENIENLQHPYYNKLILNPDCLVYNSLAKDMDSIGQCGIIVYAGKMIIGLENKIGDSIDVGYNISTEDDALLFTYIKSDLETKLSVGNKICYNDNEIATVNQLQHKAQSPSSASITFKAENGTPDTYTIGDYPRIQLNTNGVIQVENSELEYAFEMTTQNKTSINLSLVGCELPKGFEFKAYTTYVCKIIDGKICILNEFDAFPYKWVYGTYATSDYTKTFNFKDDFTVDYYDGSSTKSGTYTITELSGTYTISLKIDAITTSSISTDKIDSFDYEGNTFNKSTV